MKQVIYEADHPLPGSGEVHRVTVVLNTARWPQIVHRVLRSTARRLEFGGGLLTVTAIPLSKVKGKK